MQTTLYQVRENARGNLVLMRATVPVDHTAPGACVRFDRVRYDVKRKQFYPEQSHTQPITVRISLDNWATSPERAAEYWRDRERHKLYDAINRVTDNFHSIMRAILSDTPAPFYFTDRADAAVAPTEGDHA